MALTKRKLIYPVVILLVFVCLVVIGVLYVQLKDLDALRDLVAQEIKAETRRDVRIGVNGDTGLVGWAVAEYPLSPLAFQATLGLGWSMWLVAAIVCMCLAAGIGQVHLPYGVGLAMVGLWCGGHAEKEDDAWFWGLMTLIILAGAALALFF